LLWAASTLLNTIDTKLTSIAFDICLLNNINILSWLYRSFRGERSEAREKQ
jgi:hypothetical protein